MKDIIWPDSEDTHSVVKERAKIWLDSANSINSFKKE